MATDKEIFLATYAPAAIKEQERSGVPASLSLAQLIQESGWDLSGLARKAKNLFGIKADKSWDGEVYYSPTTEYVNGQRVTVVAGFRQYDSYEESFADHTKFFQDNRRYKNLLTMSDPYEMATELERVGYATDPNYAESLIGLIKSNDLTQYDSGGRGSVPASGDASQVGWKDAVDTGKGLLDELNKAREFFTPQYIEDFWSGMFGGEWKNPLKWNPLEGVEKGAKTLANDFFTNTVIILLLVGVGFIGYKTIVGVGGK